MPDTTVTAHGPYEDLAIEIVKLIGKIVDGQTPEVKARLWDGYLKDMDAWRAFWAALGVGK